MTRSVPSGASRDPSKTPVRHDVIVVGGGQAGLATSYYLTQQGREHVVLEQAAHPAPV